MISRIIYLKLEGVQFSAFEQFCYKVISLCMKWFHSSPSYLLAHVSPPFLSSPSPIKFYFEQNVEHVILDHFKTKLHIISIRISEEFWVVGVMEKE